MRISFQLQPSAIQQWHVRLIEAAQACEGVAAGVCLLPDRGLRQHVLRAASLDGLLALERTLAGQRVWLADAASSDELAALPAIQIGQTLDRTADWIIDLSGQPSHATDAGLRVLIPTFDGFAGTTALWNALLDGRAPAIGLAEPAAGVSTTLALPALEAPHRLLDSSQSVLVHTVAGLMRAITALSRGHDMPSFATTPLPATTALYVDDIDGTVLERGTMGVLARRVQAKAAAKRDNLLKQAPAWQVAYRATGRRTRAEEIFAPNLFQRLPDDGQRYFADPFIVHRDGWHHVFVEELPYATGKGVISHFVIDRDGKAGQPRVVLEAPHHLSYPQVFQYDGQFWMMPEASAAGRLDLYRAQRFPDLWVHHATLIDAPVHDATFHVHGGLLWIFAGMTLPGASTWDTLGLYFAERLEGPWLAHPMNPVLCDARSARPAGGLYMDRGALWRPAQDCTTGYGGALTLNRVLSLDTERFSQSLVSTLNFGAEGSGGGPHTINFAGGIEIIDIFQPRPRL